ncbi:MAG: hypothetical protein M1830_003254, partial [Pleopsidium flavum]
MLLNAARLLIYTPSQEHFGIVPLEAMLAGVPVLAANSGGPLETVVDGKTGWLRSVDDVEQWTDVMDRVLHRMSNDQLKDMGETGKTRVKAEFSERKMAERMEEVIEEMMNAPRQPALSLQDLLLGLGVLGMCLRKSRVYSSMPFPEIIDLSHETDEEDKPQTAHASPAKKPSHNKQRGGSRFILNYNNTALGKTLKEQQAKRPRLSPLPVSDDGLEMLADFVDISRRREIPKRGSTSLKASKDVSAMSKRMEEADPTVFKALKAVSSISKRFDDPDPIVFTSSPNRHIPTSRSRVMAMRELSPFSDDLDEIAPHRSRTTTNQPPKLGPQSSEHTAALLSGSSALSDLVRRLDPPRASMFDAGIGNARKETPGFVSYLTKRRQDTALLDVTSASANSRKRKFTDTEKEARELERESTKAEKAKKKSKEKDDEKERKRILKEEKAREKQLATDLAEVNKVRTDKKASTPEMIVDLPLSVEGKSVENQIKGFLKILQVQTTTYNSPVPNIIKWRRKVTAQFNEEMGHWEPITAEVRRERHVLCLLSAKEVVDMAGADPAEVDGQDLEAHVLKFKSKYEDSIPIYLIEGLEAWMRKNKNTRNRAYQAAVLSQMDGQGAEAPTASTSRRKKPSDEYIDEDMVEDALLRLQVMHGCLIHHTAVTVETAEWVANFTQHISTIPYRSQRMSMDTSFCMDVGQVKTGHDKDDTYVKMLQEIVRVTAPIAYGVAAEYPSVVNLIKGLKQRGPTALEDLKKSANKNGALSDARIGPAL